MTRTVFLASAALGLLIACASTPPSERRAQRLALFTQFAGAPVQEIRGFSLGRFEIVGPQAVVLWVRVSEPYLVSVQTCPELEWANRIGIEQRLNSLRVGFDAITVRGIDCRIREIRPIDGAALRAAERTGAG